MAVARALVQGVDVWLNTPLRPNEASGTSGMKAAANAVLNLSVPDGWWDEVWKDTSNSRKIGWAIGDGEEYADENYQDKVEAEALCDILERDVVPTFYDRGADRIPRRWVERMKASVGCLCHFVNTHRMVRDYVTGYYAKAHTQFRSLDSNNAQRARELAGTMDHICQEWPEVSVRKVEDGPSQTIPVGHAMRVSAEVHLGRLCPEDVVVELYVGRVNINGEMEEAKAVVMRSEGNLLDGNYNYAVETSIAHSGLHGFTVRVLPCHPDLPVTFVPGLICWAGKTHRSSAVAGRSSTQR